MKKMLQMILMMIVMACVAGCSAPTEQEESNNKQTDNVQLEDSARTGKDSGQQVEADEKEKNEAQPLKESKAEDFIYKEMNGVQYIVGYKGDAEIITIPTSYDGVEYSSVKWDAIYAVNGTENLSNIKKIIIPEGITRFTCDMPWNFENLESISFPSTLVETEYHDICFDICKGAKIEEVIFPEEPMVSGYFMEDNVIYKKVVYEKTSSLHEAGTEGKILCLYLGKDNEFTIPEDVTGVMEDAFECASINLKKLTVKGTIGSLAISAETLVELILSDEAKSIFLDRNALSGCDSLKSIYIGKTTEIDYAGGLHYAPLLEKITVSEEHESLFSINDILYFRNNKGEITIKLYPAGKTEEEFTLGDEVSWIGDGAFLADEDLKKLYVSSSVMEYINNMDDRRDKFASELEFIVK